VYPDGLLEVGFRKFGAPILAEIEAGEVREAPSMVSGRVGISSEDR
jgi:hypothetical protein